MHTDQIQALESLLRDNIETLSNPNSTSSAAKELGKNVDEMVKAAKAGNHQKVEEEGKNVDLAKSKLQEQALGAARASDDPIKKRQIL